MTPRSGAGLTALFQSHRRTMVPLYRTPLGPRIRVGGLVTRSGVPDPTYLGVLAVHAQTCGQKGPATRGLSPGLELDVLDGDVVDGEVEVVDCTHDGGVEAVGDDPAPPISWYDTFI